VTRLFALDQNFPQPLVNAAAPFFREVELAPVWEVDPRLAELDDWELLLALHHHERPFDGLITTDDSMLNQARELEVVRQTNLTLVVVRAAGHDPIKATGLLFAHLDYVVAQTTPDRPQVWALGAQNRPAKDPYELIERVADHQNRPVADVLREARLSRAELDRDPLDG
jgi:hypothetical protein